MDDLTPHQRDILDFELRTFTGAGAKEQAIAEVFGLGSTNYYQQLNAVLESQAALAHHPPGEPPSSAASALPTDPQRPQHRPGTGARSARPAIGRVLSRG